MHREHKQGGYETSDHNIYSAATHHYSETMESSSEEMVDEAFYPMPSRKTILSEARDKATTAVELDNGGAWEAYSEAYTLLQQALSHDMAGGSSKVRGYCEFPRPPLLLGDKVNGA